MGGAWDAPQQPASLVSVWDRPATAAQPQRESAFARGPSQGQGPTRRELLQELAREQGDPQAFAGDMGGGRQQHQSGMNGWSEPVRAATAVPRTREPGAEALEADMKKKYGSDSVYDPGVRSPPTVPPTLGRGVR